MKDWKPYKFGSFLNRADRFEAKDDFKNYTFSGTYSYARGIFSSYSKAGTEFNLSKIQRIKKDDFIFCKIMAWEGAFGLAPEECNDTVMSGAFVAYEIDRDIVEPKFLDYFFKIEKNWKNVGSGSTGTNVRRKTLFAADFEKYEITLPPLTLQQQIIAKVESITQRIEQIKNLRAEQEKEIVCLRNSIFIDLQKEFENFPIRKVLVPHSEMIEINPNETYKQVTVRIEHNGVLLRGLITGSEIGSKQFLANENDFIISKIDARSGAMGMIPADLQGAVVTNDFPLFSFTEGVNPKYFYYFSNTFYFDDACKKASEGTTNRKRLKMDKFDNIQIPLPPIEEQNRIVSLLDKLNGVKTNHTETEKELTQLMPSILDKAFKGEL